MQCGHWKHSNMNSKQRVKDLGFFLYPKQILTIHREKCIFFLNNINLGKSFYVILTLIKGDTLLCANKKNVMRAFGYINKKHKSQTMNFFRALYF